MNSIESLMREWLASDDAAKVRHAKARIAIGFDPHDGPHLPPLSTQIGNAFSAAARVATAVATGTALMAPPETVSARLAVCNGCDQRTAGGRCAGCGCWVRAKASLATEQCPLNRWPVPDD